MDDTPALPTIDADELFDAMTIGDHVIAYLDPASGAIEYVPEQGWDVDEGDEEAFASWVVIEQVENTRRYAWMQAFAASLDDAPDVARMLDVALDGRGAFARFFNVLDGHPDLRARWQIFRAERLRERAKSWLEREGLDHPLAKPRAFVEQAAPPPTDELGLIHVLLLGAPEGKTERIEGKVRRIVEAADAKRAKQLFRRFVRHACGFEGIDYRRSLVDGRNALSIGPFEIERRGSSIEVRVAISPRVWDAFVSQD